MAQKNFNEVVNFNRGTGSTRVNPAGLIVGVDFSSSSIVFGTGPKVFTLTADANVNRDWSIGEPVIAVSQATPLGSLTGTVTAYDPVTQELTIEVATSTGTGTATNWRIGSLAVRRDAKGILREPQATNLFNGSYTASSVTVTAGGIAPNGSASVRLQGTGAASVYTRNHNSLVVGQTYVQTATIRARTPGTNDKFRLLFNQGNGVHISQDITATSEWVRHSFSVTVTNLGLTSGGIGRPSNNADWDIEFMPNSDQLEVGSFPTSLIPTTTVAVTRAADVFEATAETIEAIRQGQGTIIVEAETEDNGLAQKRAVLMSGGTGSIRVAKEGVVASRNFRGLAESANIIAFGSNSGGTLATLSNGLDFREFNLVGRGGNSVVNISQGYFATDGSSFAHVGTYGESIVGQTLNCEVLIENLSTAKVLGVGSETFNAAHWTSSQFVLPMGKLGTVALSNGDSYRIINDPNITQPCNDATHDPVSGRIVIVGNNGYIGTSDDGGETWTQKISGNTANLSTVEYTGVNFVAKAAGGRPIISTDNGDTFVPRSPGQFLDGGELHFANGVLVSVGATGDIRYSLDHGETWTPATSNTTVQLNAVRYTDQVAGGLWVACGANGTVLTAVDPTGSWTVYDNTTTPATGNNNVLSGVTYFANKFFISNSSARQMFTFDPVAVSFTPLVSALGSGSFKAIETNGTRVILVGSNGSFDFTEDAQPVSGSGFTSRTNNNATLNGIAYGINRFVSVGNAVNGSGYIATIDPDGTVTRRVTTLTTALLNVRFLRNEFYTLAVGATQFRFNQTTFAQRTVSVGLNTTYNDISDDGTYLILVGLNGTIRYSTDDVTYVASTSNTTQALNAVASANNLSVAVGNAGVIVTTNTPTSPWTPRTSGTTQTLRSVIYSERDERWYVAGDNGTLLYSDDNAQTFHPVQNASFAAIDNNGVQANPLAAAWQQGVNKIALSYKANEVKLSINGSAPVTDTLATIPSITSMLIGDNFNGYIKRIKFYPLASDDKNIARISMGLEPVNGVDELAANDLGDQLATDTNENTLSV